MHLEKMGEFFDRRLSEYEHHQLHCIEYADVFYPFTARQLPAAAGCRVLDLGCGTGLELDMYFEYNPHALVTGIDLAPGMLRALGDKHPDKHLSLVYGSYFDVPFGVHSYDAAVSVESLHHFTQAQKIPLYTKLQHALKQGGYFILTDYFAQDDAQENACFEELAQLKRAEHIEDGVFYHYDTPLTLEHESQALLAGGFKRVERLGQWGATACLKAYK